jgi:small subunit ribosomal protein S6e
MKVVINDTKTGKSYQIEGNVDGLVGYKIGEEFEGSLIGLNGFKLKITGGSTDTGTPMRKDIEGTKKVYALLSKGPGYKPKRKNVRKRKLVRGNTIAYDIAQINCVVVEGDVSQLEKKGDEN